MGLLDVFRRKQPTVAAAPKVQSVTAFDAGRGARRLRSVPMTQETINRQIRAYGKTVLARSRYLCANNSYAAAAKEAWVNALVGAGIVPSPLLDNEAVKKAIKLTFRDWSDESDADGLTDFYGQQYIIAGEMFEAGECFIRLRPRRPEDGLIVPLQLQILPSEMLDVSYNVSAINGSNRIECGIEFDVLGRRVAYHFFREHPGTDIYARQASAFMRTRVPAEEVLHLFKPMVAGQVRGLPHTLPGIVRLAIVDSYEDAELERKRTAALFAGYVKRDAPDTDAFPLEAAAGPEMWDPSQIPGMPSAVGLEPGAMFDLAPGEDVTFAEPADVGATYEPFLYRQLLGVAAGFGVPYMQMTGDLRQTSYGSQRGGEIAFRRRIEAMQNHVMIFQLCRPVYNRWLRDAIMVGAIDGIPRSSFIAAPQQYTRVRWMPPKWDWIDPLKDRQAEKLAVDEGWKSRDDVIEAEGYDPEENDQRIKSSQERAESLNIDIRTAATTPPAAEDDDPPSGNNPKPEPDPARKRRARA